MLDFNLSYGYLVGFFGSIRDFFLTISTKLKSCYVEVIKIGHDIALLKC